MQRTDTSGNARRKQKIYQDILGRTYKTETFDWAGNVYLRTEHDFNGRDQIVQTDQTDVAASPDVVQTTTASYDGHGRLATTHKPEQRDSSNNLKYTTYSYNKDDSISTITDGRGAVTNYEYNSRGLLTEKSWTDPGGSGITVPSNVSFVYDNAGNRTSMTDGLGSVSYAYNSLSQMTDETRVFSDEDTGFPNDTATLSYTYTIGGQLESYGASFGSSRTVTSAFDKIGRLVGATATFTGGSVNYITGASYRAWGVAKQVQYGNGVEMNASDFNNRLQATEFEVKKSTTYIIDKSYQFNPDGTVRLETDNLNAKFDRYYEYDHQGRLTKTLTGAEARGSTDNYNNIPYHNTYGHDAFNHRTSLGIANFQAPGTPQTMTYTNNRITGGSLWPGQYDEEGYPESVPGNGKYYYYDAAGRVNDTLIQLVGAGEEPDYSEQREEITHDGDGRAGKIIASSQLNEETPETETTYRVHSTVLGGAVVFDGAGKAYDYAGGTRISNDGYWAHQDANGHTLRSTDSNGNVAGDGSYGTDWDKMELDPDGKNAGLSAPVYFPLEANDLFAPMSNFGQMSHGQYTSYTVDGISVLMDYLAMRLGSSNPESSIGIRGFFGDFLPLQRIGNSILFPTSERIRETRRYAGWDGADLYDYEYQSLGAGGWSYFGWGVSLPGEEPTTVEGPTGPPTSPTTCYQIVSLARANSDEGALARLIFQEATDLARFANTFPNNPSNAMEYYDKELKAIAAVVLNRVHVLNTRPDLITGFGSRGASVTDVVYSRGATGTQFAGFTPNGIAKGIENRISAALNSAADSSECSKLQDAINTAQTYRRGADSLLDSLFSIRTAGSSSPGGNFQIIDWVAGSGNDFYTLTQAFLNPRRRRIIRW